MTVLIEKTMTDTNEIKNILLFLTIKEYIMTTIYVKIQIHSFSSL